MCNVTPCSRRSCTRKLVARISLLSSSRTSTFHTSGPCTLPSMPTDGEDGRGNGPVEDEDGGGWLRFNKVNRAFVWAWRSVGRVMLTDYTIPRAVVLPLRLVPSECEGDEQARECYTARVQLWTPLHHEPRGWNRGRAGGTDYVKKAAARLPAGNFDPACHSKSSFQALLEISIHHILAVTLSSPFPATSPRPSIPLPIFSSPRPPSTLPSSRGDWTVAGRIWRHAAFCRAKGRGPQPKAIRLARYTQANASRPFFRVIYQRGADYYSKHIQFQPLQPADIVKISEVEVVHQELYTNHDNGLRTTAKDGPLDGRMVGCTFWRLGIII